MRQMTIAGRRIADDEPCYVVAEVGQNHQGRFRVACDLVAAAAAAGADAVKFQKREVHTLYTEALLQQPYSHEHSFGETYGLHRDALELTAGQHRDLLEVARARVITAFATAFDEPSADLLFAIGAPAIKLASGAMTDRRLVQHVGRLGLPVIASTGGGGWREVDQLVDWLDAVGAEYALLHCTAAYPADWADLHLALIPQMRARYPETVIGWSSHDSGIAMAVVAYTLGARIIEKHFTLNRAQRGTDHGFSLEPVGLRKLVRDLGRARIAMGDGEKRYLASEVAPIAKMRRRETPGGWRITGERDHVEP